MTSVPSELRYRGELRGLNGRSLADVSCYILEELDETGQPRWRGFCQVQASRGLLPGRQRLMLVLENGAWAELNDAQVSLEADSHSLRATFARAKPQKTGPSATLHSEII